MALVARSSKANIGVANAQYAPQVAGNLYAGEALDPVAPAHIEADGLVYLSNATAADADAEIDGWTARAYAAGDPVTLIGRGARAKYSDGNLTPGARYYLAATDGRLDTAPTPGDSQGVAKAIDANDIRLIRDA
jgi:hypothetical protein